jgi:hypothetical protein
VGLCICFPFLAIHMFRSAHPPPFGGHNGNWRGV